MGNTHSEQRVIFIRAHSRRLTSGTGGARAPIQSQDAVQCAVGHKSRVLYLYDKIAIFQLGEFAVGVTVGERAYEPI